MHAAAPEREEEEERFELVELAGGARSLRSLANRQTFHPVVGPAAEARAVHVEGARIVERAPGLGGSGGMVIWDVGLGAAANALTAIETLRAAGQLHRPAADVRLLSFDRTAAALDFAIDNAAALSCPAHQRRWLETLRAEGRASIPLSDGAPDGPAMRWEFCRGDFPALLRGPAELPAPHAIFFDPYSPAVNPEMWTLELFVAVRARLRPEAPCLLTTYTRSTAVRATLLLAGFHVGIGHATGEKDQTTVAANDLLLLKRPLDRRWLDRARASTNAAPLRAATYTRQPISEADFEALCAHPQFQAAA
jgi:tRNA U34 5-methylaminomethyl-2-thiouridine-forming methyltransferase MnmC